MILDLIPMFDLCVTEWMKQQGYESAELLKKRKRRKPRGQQNR
jgi:hypothetical protein